MTSDDRSMSVLDREALALLVRLDDQPDDDAAHAALATWLERGPAHRASWDRALDLAATVEVAVPPVLTGKRADNVVPLRPAATRRGAIVRHWRMAGALAVAACLGLVVAPDVALRMRAQEITGTGEVRQVVLDDGTRVHLAPGSALSFDARGGQRSAHLLRGRAYFDVAHDAARPFRVFANDTVITVLGTAFEVDDHAASAAVAVRRGAVAVDYGHGPRTVLHKGETVALDAQGRIARGAMRTDRIAGWMSGRIFVKDRPVGEVLEDLRPWYRGYILARGSRLASRRVTGIYDLRDPDAALAAIAKVHPLRVRRITPWVKIVSVD